MKEAASKNTSTNMPKTPCSENYLPFCNASRALLSFPWVVKVFNMYYSMAPERA